MYGGYGWDFGGGKAGLCPRGSLRGRRRCLGYGAGYGSRYAGYGGYGAGYGGLFW